MTIRELLKDKMTKRELEHVPSSFEIIGSREKAVAIVELHFKIRPKAKLIANAIMKKHRNVKTVLLKESPRTGEFRNRKYTRITGLKNTEVIHLENGCRIMVDPQTSYFSPRESTERMRIIEKVLEGQNVMVFFAGVGPFAIEIARKTKANKVVGIEINPAAVDYFVKNIRLNKLNNVEVVLGDVAQHAPEFSNQFDHVLMPLPERSSEYLREAIDCLKHGGTCHFYFFENEDKVGNWKKRIRDISKSVKKKAKILETKKVLPYGPGIWKWRIDFTVS
jgi:tRNA (guanine37-N1)-methyltransferase